MTTPDISFFDLGSIQEQVVQSPASGGAGGTVSAILAQVPSASETWKVERIVISTTSTTNSTCILYDNVNVTPSAIIAATSQGNLDFDDAPAIVLNTGKTLQAVWSNMSNGAVGTMRVIYRVYRQG